MLITLRPTSCKTFEVLLRTYFLRTNLSSLYNVLLFSTSNNYDNSSTLPTISTTREKINEFRVELENGPQLGDFIAGVVPRNVNTYADYSEKIKRVPGESGRFVI